MPHSDACFAAAGVALAAAALTGGRRYLYLLLAYLAAADIVLGTIPSPSGAAQWGAVVIAGAFAVFGAAFLVTRRALAAGRSGRAGTVLETADGAGGAR